MSEIKNNLLHYDTFGIGKLSQIDLVRFKTKKKYDMHTKLK